MNIYIWRNEEITGPFSREVIFLRLKNSQLTLDTLACVEGDSEWKVLGDILKPVTVENLVPQDFTPAEFRASFSLPERKKRPVSAGNKRGAYFAGISGASRGLAKLLMQVVAMSAIAIAFFAWMLHQPAPVVRVAEVPRASSGISIDFPEDSRLAVAPPPVDQDIVREPPKERGVPRLLGASDPPGRLQPAVTLEAPVAEPVADDEATEEARKSALRPLPDPASGDFFRIHAVKIVQREPRESAAWLQLGTKRLNWTNKVFIPYIEVELQTSEQYESKDTFVRIHVFDRNKNPVSALEEPAIAWRDRTRGYSVPVLYPKGKRERIFFPVPETFDPSGGSMLVVFGDENSAAARIFPSTVSTFGLDFPERVLVERRDKDVEREAAINPVVETVIETRNEKQPVITLFMRMPIGLKDARQAKGVLALCLLANNADQIRSMLQKMDRSEDDRIYSDMKRAWGGIEKRIDLELASSLKTRVAERKPEADALLVEDLMIALKAVPVDPEDRQLADCRALVGSLAGRVYQNNLVKFADRHQLAILAWGARRLWDPKLSFDEQTKKINREMDDTFDDVAKAWEKGVDKLSKQYGFPNRNFLLTGQSGAAQYACRLALRVPDRFLAVRVHIPSSFDRPTPEACRVLWLLTTGEKEGGYPAAKRFFNDCKQLGYPMIFKAIPGLGHQGSRVADELALEFFEYALTLKGERERLAQESQKTLVQQSIGRPEPWPSSFKVPKSVGDILNQDIFPHEDAEIVASEFQVALPTESIARAWMQ